MEILSASPTPDTSSDGLKGRIHGGQQPIVGAKIYLLAAGTAGYGSASTSLLSSASYPGYPSKQDSPTSPYYVLTDANGFFQIVDTCTPGQQVYVASVGGNAGSGSNSAATEIAILGQCPSAGNFDTTLTNVFISEISTVAAAYATAAYAKDTFDIGGPSATGIEQTGIANAFANAANLFDIQDINDLARTSTVSANGTVPQAKIQTLANILASCINSSGPTSSTCSTLFKNATTTGTSSGTAPTDVTTAAMNIAHNPWANTTALYGLQSSTPPFATKLGTQPNDFSLAINFTNAALASNPSLAIDGNGNVWTVAPGQAAVTKLSSTGAVLSGSTGYAIGGGFANARGLALDTSNNLWILGLGQTTANIFGYSPPGATFAELLNGTGLPQPPVIQENSLLTHPPTGVTNLVLDGLGNFIYSAQYTELGFSVGNCCTEKYNLATGVFTNLDLGNASPGTNSVAVSSTYAWATADGAKATEISGFGNQGITGGGLNGALGVALDNSNNAWIVNSGGGSVSEFSSAGTVLSGTTGYMGGLSTPKAIAIDGLGNAWVTNTTGSFGLSEFSNAGAVIGTGYSDTNLSNASALAIDPSGDVWVASSGSTTISEFVGVAAPVVTPMAAAISAGTLGTRP